MWRSAYQDLLVWKQSVKRKPLILSGARQVGKTTLLKTFAAKEYDNFLYLNFEELPSLKKLFLEDLIPSRIIQALSLTFNESIQVDNTLLIFDEIQECPEALNSLKYFCENAPEYHVCAAGSLLGVTLVHTKGFPVGKVDFIDLYPMTFIEYLDANGEIKLKDFLSQTRKIEPLAQIAHEKLIKIFKTYLFVGGMPEAVACYIENKDFLKVRKKQSDILKAYIVDFSKHAPKNEISKINEVWQCLPAQLAKENKKFIYSKIKESARGREYDNAIEWIVDAGLAYKVFNVNTANLPLRGFADVNVFKIYMLDVGLLGAMADISPKAIIDEDDLFSQYNGAFIENYIAQVLVQHEKNLHYWTSSGKAELDYLIQYKNDIFPIEVKSGSSRQKKSLKVYIEKFQPSFSIVISPANLKLDGKVMNCPLYMSDYLCSTLIPLVD